MQAIRAVDKMKQVAFIPGARHIPDLIILCVVTLAQAAGLFFILRGPMARALRWARWTLGACAIGSVALECFGVLLGFTRFDRHFTLWFSSCVRGVAIGWSLLSLSFLVAFGISHLFLRILPRYSGARRGFLRAAQVVLFGAPVAAIGYGVFIERLRISLREETIRIPGLHPDLDGLRLVQLTDIHLSPFLSERELARAVAMANETRAHIALITGDLITERGNPLDACLERLACLRADAGVFGCLGNHEVYAGVEDYTLEKGARLGIRFLRSAAVPLRRGDATLNLAGVDYQRFSEPYLVGAERLVKPGAFNLLLSHNPDVFPVAARQGYQLTLAGHTHGGQVRVEILRQDLNIARFFTRYVDGVYRDGSSSIFVSRGIGTLGLPARLGAPPEVAFLRLCRT